MILQCESCENDVLIDLIYGFVIDWEQGRESDAILEVPSRHISVEVEKGMDSNRYHILYQRIPTVKENARVLFSKHGYAEREEIRNLIWDIAFGATNLSLTLEGSSF